MKLGTHSAPNMLDEHVYSCYFCGKTRPRSHLRAQKILTVNTVFVCDDKYINDCVDDSLMKFKGYTRCAP